MKRLIITFTLALVTVCAMSQEKKEPNFVYKEATDLTVIGKVFPDTPKPYERLDYEKYPGFNRKEINLLQMTSGIAVSFKTDSPMIAVRAKYAYLNNGASSRMATRGFDLYIKKDGQWLFAGCSSAPDDISKPHMLKLADNMDDSMKECLVYFPTYSKLESVKIAVRRGCFLEPGEVPFRHRVVIFGSSFTHGSSTTRAGLTYPAIFTRRTGIQLLSMGVSGNCTMQEQFANAFKDADADAFIFDSFSNGSPETIKANLFNFIEILQEAHPGKPLIFQRTVWRENRNFDNKIDKREKLKARMADSLMTVAMKKYKDVYLISPCATSEYHETTADGTHFGDYGYTLWAESIIEPVMKILKKYGIK